MSESLHPTEERQGLRRLPLPMPRSSFLMWLNIGLALVVAAIGFGLGFAEGIAAQLVILYTIVSVAVFLWLLNAIAIAFESRFLADVPAAGAEEEPSEQQTWWQNNRVMILSMALLLLVYLIVTATVPSFRSLENLLAFLVLELILLFAFKVSGLFAQGRSAFIGLIILVALLVISAFTIEGFLSGPSIRAILLFAAFLGIASIGQTMVALLGGLDLSIPFVIGASNIGLMFLIQLGVLPWLATVFVLLIGAALGLINGLLSYRLQGQVLIVTLGMGFAIAGFVQILTSIGSEQAGNVMGVVPDWLRNLAAMNGRIFGMGVPPVIVIWIALAVLVIGALRFSAMDAISTRWAAIAARPS